MKRFLTITLLILLSVGLFVSCSDDAVGNLFYQSLPEYTVAFNTKGGSSISSLTVKKGEKITPPANPTKDDFIFEKWYSDENLINEYTFDSPVTKDITLYANWIDTRPYLCFTAEQKGSTVKLIANGTWDSYPAILYSVDINNEDSWTPLEIGPTVTEGTKITLEDVGDSVYLKADDGNTQFSQSTSKYLKFELTGKIAASGNIMYLIDSTGATQTAGSGAFAYLFKDCTALVSAKNLTLRATQLSTSCYLGMFQGCTALTVAPALPATTLAQSCYSLMFQDCTALAVAPALPATTLAQNCYTQMFQGCTSLVAAPALPAKTLAPSCYWSMFKNCTALTSAPALPAKTLADADHCYSAMFSGCTALTSAPALPAETLANDCYGSMFNGCTTLTSAPELPAKTLKKECYKQMFQGCIALTSAPALPAKTLAPSCYLAIFQGCTALASAPALPAKTLADADHCYSAMFSGCTALTSAPALPAETLANDCYGSMFNGCTTLTSAPALPAETLKQNCYSCMFQGCTALTSAPVLPATTLAKSCYGSMFNGCTSLTTAPALPATTLALNCYEGMFYGCTSLTTVPELPAENLADYCYKFMFEGCHKLAEIRVRFTAWSTSRTDSWIRDVAESGDFYCPQELAEKAEKGDGYNYIPSGWTTYDIETGLKMDGN